MFREIITPDTKNEIKEWKRLAEQAGKESSWQSRARVPSYYRQSIQNAVNRQINLGRTKTAASLNREAIGQVVSYCFVAAAHDILDFDAGRRLC